VSLRSGCVIRARLLARSGTAPPRRRQLRWLVRRGECSPRSRRPAAAVTRGSRGPALWVGQYRDAARSGRVGARVRWRRSVLLRGRKQRGGQDRPPAQARLRDGQRLGDPRRLHEPVTLAVADKHGLASRCAPWRKLLVSNRWHCITSSRTPAIVLSSFPDAWHYRSSLREALRTPVC
jgi:hypothetical protein